MGNMESRNSQQQPADGLVGFATASQKKQKQGSSSPTSARSASNPSSVRSRSSSTASQTSSVSSSLSSSPVDRPTRVVETVIIVTKEHGQDLGTAEQEGPTFPVQNYISGNNMALAFQNQRLLGKPEEFVPLSPCRGQRHDALRSFVSCSTMQELQQIIADTHSSILVFDDVGTVVYMSKTCKSMLKSAIKGRRRVFRSSPLNLKHVLMPQSLGPLTQALDYVHDKRPLEAATMYAMTNRGQDVQIRIRLLRNLEGNDLPEHRVFFVASIRPVSDSDSGKSLHRTVPTESAIRTKKRRSQFIVNRIAKGLPPHVEAEQSLEQQEHHTLRHCSMHFRGNLSEAIQIFEHS